MTSAFVDVLVEEHDAIPDGCSLRFRAQPGQGGGRPIEHVRWESESGVAGRWHVEACGTDDTRGSAMAYAVDDSSAGTSIVIVGGRWGLRLTSVATGQIVAEPYLLVSPDAAT